MTVARNSQPAPRDASASRVYDAWTRFVEGDDDVSGVRPEVAISWQRSRDVYRIDPFLSEAPDAGVSGGAHSLDQDVVFAELGFCASAMVHEVANAGGVITVADANGRILTAWGDRRTRAIATAGGLAPWFCWSEGAVGTNSMGTALETRRAVAIRRTEHWCQAFHDWSCAGIAIRDVVSKEPLAVLNISCWQSDLPPTAQRWLEGAARHTMNSLRSRATDSGSELLAAYTVARGRSSMPLIAVDTSGSIVVADEDAGALLGVPSDVPAIDPVARVSPRIPQLVNAIEYASRRANADPEWTGSTQIFAPFADEPSSVGIRPVFLHSALIGHLVSFGAFAGEHFPHPESAGVLQGVGQPAGAIRRILAHPAENRTVLLDLAEVVLAETDGNEVSLLTNDGKLRAAITGLDKLESDLTDTGNFLRVHRQHLVNLNRIREVERGEKGELVLVMNDPHRTKVPVSRRNVATIRRALHL